MFFCLVIQGRDKKTVRAAKLKLELLVDQARKRQPFTHFLSLPCTSSSVKDGFIRFKVSTILFIFIHEYSLTCFFLYIG